MGSSFYIFFTKRRRLFKTVKTSSTKYVTNNDKGSSKRLDTCSSNTNKKLIPKSEYYEVIAKLVIEKEGRLKDNTLMNKKLLDFEEEVKTLRKKPSMSTMVLALPHVKYKFTNKV